MFGVTFALLPLLLTLLATIETLDLSLCLDEVNTIRHLIEQCQTIELFDKTVKSKIEAGIRALISILEVQKMYDLIDMLLVYLPVVIPIDMDRLVDCLTMKRDDKFVVKTNSCDYTLTLIESYIFVGIYTALLESFKLLIRMFICCDVYYLDSPSDFDITQIAINCVQNPCDEYITLTKQMWTNISIASSAVWSNQYRNAANALWNALMCYILKSAVLSFGGPKFSKLGVDDLSNSVKRTTRLVNTMWNMLRYIIIMLKEFNIDCPLSEEMLINKKWVREAGVGVLTILAEKFSGKLQPKYKPTMSDRCSIGMLYGVYQRIINKSRCGVPGINQPN